MNILRALVWSARVTAIILFVFWGMFFTEHLSEWYIGKETLPPLRVTLSFAAHGILLLGYLISLKYEKAGSIIIIIFSTVFFLPLMGVKGIPFLLISILPAALFLMALYPRRHSATPTHDQH